MRKFKKYLVISGIVLGVLFLVATTYAYYGNYSEGQRTGTIIKISKKGYIFRTWEGELDVGGISTSKVGNVSSMWSFSIDPDNQEVIQALENATGRIRIKYVEKFYRIPWKGETKYFVTKVEVVQ